MIKSERFSNRIYGVVMLFVVGVIFVHGMVENFGLLGKSVNCRYSLQLLVLHTLCFRIICLK